MYSIDGEWDWKQLHGYDLHSSVHNRMFTSVADPIDDCTRNMPAEKNLETGVRGLVQQELAEEWQGNSFFLLFIPTGEDFDETNTITGRDSDEESLVEII